MIDLPSAADSALGKPTAYAERYDPGLLFALPRAGQRAALGLSGIPLHGVDLWNAWELSWLALGGLPQVAVAELRVPADSPRLIESKSLKLYLNGFMQQRAASAAEVADRIRRDLSAAAGAAVQVQLHGLDAVPGLARLQGCSIDDRSLAIEHYGPPQAALLAVHDEVVEECLVSDLLKSNCPVTGQPDWASVQIRYRGPRLDRAGLLRYLVSFRRHAEFHEHCVERIFCDLWQRARPEQLSIYARYTRRGGLDINPFRSSDPQARPDNPRLARQ
jgi:7-cyano-7-deazaguanine reductase